MHRGWFYQVHMSCSLQGHAAIPFPRALEAVTACSDDRLGTARLQSFEHTSKTIIVHQTTTLTEVLFDEMVISSRS